MLVGAIAGFAAGLNSGSLLVAFGAAMLAGVAMSLIFGVLALTLQTNQVATGLALTLFGVGLSAFVGRAYAGQPIPGLKAVAIPVLSDLPVIGPLLFRFDPLVYGTILLFVAAQWFLYRSRGGLLLRAVGESPEVAHSLGYPVLVVRYLSVMFGGAMAGLAGAYLSCALTPMWTEGLSAGTWMDRARARWCSPPGSRGALLRRLPLRRRDDPATARAGLRHRGALEFMSMLPYAATIVVLVAICRNPRTILLNQPGSLGRPSTPTRDLAVHPRLAFTPRTLAASHRRHRVDRCVVLLRVAGRPPGAATRSRRCREGRGR